MSVAQSGPVSLPASAPILPQVPSRTPETAAAPASCPSWCRETHDVTACGVLGVTTHLSSEHSVANPDPLDDAPALMMRAQLLKIDRAQGENTLVMYVNGESDVELGGDDADILIAQMQAFVDTLRVLRRQMG